MTGEEFLRLRRSLQLTQNEMASALGVASRVLIARWENGDRPVPPMAARLVRVFTNVEGAFEYVWSLPKEKSTR